MMTWVLPSAVIARIERVDSLLAEIQKLADMPGHEGGRLTEAIAEREEMLKRKQREKREGLDTWKVQQRFH